MITEVLTEIQLLFLEDSPPNIEGMKFLQQKIRGVYIIEPAAFIDQRGIYRRHFCQKEFKDHSIDFQVVQANIVENKHRYTIRGFHFQKPPFSEGKMLSCIKGSAYDIVLDIDPKSPTYLKWEGFELNGKNRNSLYIPPGCTHAILTLEENTMIHYYTSEFYNPKAEGGIRYNDPYFKFYWPHQPKVISEKDKSHPDFTAIR